MLLCHRLRQRKPGPTRAELESGLPDRREVQEEGRPNFPPLMSLPLSARVNRVRAEPDGTPRVLVPIPRAPAPAKAAVQDLEPHQPESKNQEETPEVVELAEEDPPACKRLSYMEMEPTTEESSRLNERLEVWRRRIGEAKTPLDPVEFPQRIRRRDPQIGYPGFLAVEQLVRLQNEFLEQQRIEEMAKSRPVLHSKPRIPEVPNLSRRKVCTDDLNLAHRPGRVWKQPASATISRNPDPEEELSSMSFQALTATPTEPERDALSPCRKISSWRRNCK